VADVLAVLSLLEKPNRFRWLEFCVMIIIALIFICFTLELVRSRLTKPPVQSSSLVERMNERMNQVMVT
jgi:Mn2+/Fe2+ NRAMP family transporter